MLGAKGGTGPAVVAAVVAGLLGAGLPPKNIIIWDKQITHLRLAGFSELADRYHIRIAGSSQAGYDEKAFYDNAILGNMEWGDSVVGKTVVVKGRYSCASKLRIRVMEK